MVAERLPDGKSSAAPFPGAATMASAEQVMEAITQAVSVAVAAAMKEMTTVAAGGGGRTMGLQQAVDTTVKRMDKFGKDNFADWKFKLEVGLRGSHSRLAELLKWAEEHDGSIDMDLMSEEEAVLTHNLY